MSRASTLPSVFATTVETSLGWIAFAWRDQCLTRLTFGHRDPQSALRALDISDCEVTQPGGFAGKLAKRLRDYANGKPDDFSDVAIELGELTEFQRAVVDHCRQIRPGQTLTYQELADRAGSPRAYRAVGNVMRSNRFPLIVPCHRVVGSNGGLGGYSAPDGLQMKRRLLDLEASRTAVSKPR